MRVLFVSNSFPNNLSSSKEPSVGGTQRRLDMLIQALGNIAQLDVLFYVPDDIEISPRAIARVEQELSAYWNVKLTLHLCSRFSLPKWRHQLEGLFDFSKQSAFINTRGSEQIQAFEDCLDRSPDAIVVQRLQSIYPVLATRRSLPPVFYDIDDIEHIKLIRQLRQPFIPLAQLLYYLQLPALWWGELRAIKQANRSFVCSEGDHRYLSERWRLPGVVTISNSISIPPAQITSADSTLLLVGSYRYPPNIDAANFLIEAVLPLIRHELPQAKLIIAGPNPEQIRSYEQGAENVEFTGFVDDLDQLYQRSRVVCCPIFAGGGTRIKMIEAAAYGKPIVATSIGAEGLNLVPDQHFLLRNTATDFAAACLELLRSDALCDRLGISARQIAEQNYDINAIYQRIQQQVLEEIDDHQREQLTLEKAPLSF